MSTNSAALSRLIEQVEAGTDALLTGSPGETRCLLAEAADRLRPACCVVEVAAEAAGLSLSRLMAQLSGRGDLDAQDDAVLELGFRRLAVPEVPGQRTVLLLNASHGIQRSALRFLQHVGRGAPGLVMVVAAGAELYTLLEEPCFSALRARLTTARPVVSNGPAPIAQPIMLPLLAAPAALAAVLEADPAPPPPSPSMRPAAAPRVARGRSRVWVISGVGMAASLALGAWIGHASAPRVTLMAAGASGSALAPQADAFTSAPDASSDVTPAGTIQHSATPSAAPVAEHLPRIALTMKIEPAAIPAPIPATPAAGVLAVPSDPDPAAAPALALAAPVDSAPTATTPTPTMQQDAVVPGLLEQSVPAENSADAFNPAPDHGAETLQSPTLAATALPAAAVLPAPVPKAELSTAPPAFAPKQPVQASLPALAEDEARQGESAADPRTKLALARPAPVLELPLPPSPPKADPSLHALNSKRFEPRPKDAPAHMVERRTRSFQTYREPEAARYDYDWEDQGPPPVYRAPPGWGAPRSVPPAEGQYIGTYAAGPYGMRTFRYER